MKARQRIPTKLVLFRLLSNARLQRDAHAANKHFGMPYAEALNQSHRELEALVVAMEEVFVEPEKQILLADELDTD